MWYGKVPPSPFPFLKPGFVKRKHGNKLEPKAVLCFYIGPSPNRPRDSMRVMLRSGAMIDSRHVTWACIPSLTLVPDYPVGSMTGRGRGGSKTAELRSEEVESAGVESDASEKDQVDVWSEGSESKPVNVEVDCGESEDDDEEVYIFPQCAPAPAPATAPKGRAAQLPSLTPASPVPSTREMETGEAIPPPVLGGREAARLKRTAKGPTGTVEGRTRGDVRRLQALHGAALVAREMGMEAAFEDSVFLVAHDSYVGTLSDLEDKFPIEGAADIAFQMETQKMANFLDGLESAGKTDGTFLSVFETTIGSGFVCLRVCDDVAFATSEEFGLAAVEDITIGHISEVEEPPLRVGDVKYKNLRGVWEDAMRAEFKGLVSLNAFEFVDVVPNGVNVVSARWVFAWKVDKDGNIVKPKARLVARGFSRYIP